MTQSSAGRRERKKAATRQALADAALRLFLERGFDQVSVKEIADAADVSTTTLFNHFRSKEALVFDREADHEAGLVACVQERAPEQTIPQALRACLGRMYLGPVEHPGLAEFLALVRSAPALREYEMRMWRRHEKALAAAVAAEIGVAADDVACATLARMTIEALDLAHGRPDPEAALDRIFVVIEHGWTASTR
ncbi:TetR/AcrR family transcriptional regulator [Pseudonocardia sp. DSM 110487]|uniref:TetR/AcrR family transcriptional regulator n=1 Tax=Pseudonocardia sp. DSM 110487 TaxID=2865833 RepID=UPI001C695905|nr:TetR/AcrR family transcriptional regulator [Pseudonocardia sp. DSM 110487]QYN32312.1 TetR/AcrR family transcriptional regulator [Pseudonocardia sp. DSM 110487]